MNNNIRQSEYKRPSKTVQPALRALTSIWYSTASTIIKIQGGRNKAAILYRSEYAYPMASRFVREGTNVHAQEMKDNYGKEKSWYKSYK